MSKCKYPPVDFEASGYDKKTVHPEGGITYVVYPKISKEENARRVQNCEDTLNRLLIKIGIAQVTLIDTRLTSDKGA